MRMADVSADETHGGRLNIANVSITLGEGADAFEAVRELEPRSLPVNWSAFSARRAVASQRFWGRSQAISRCQGAA
jgi:hypothetical protein